MIRALMHTTRIAIMVEADTAQIAELVHVLTALVSLLLTVGGWVRPIVIFAGDFVEAANFTGKVLTIGFTALLFGLGVTR